MKNLLTSLWLSIGLTFPGTTLASAQTLVGSVRDTSSAVRPGVAVEASSPPLIEKVRAAIAERRDTE